MIAYADNFFYDYRQNCFAIIISFINNNSSYEVKKGKFFKGSYNISQFFTNYIFDQSGRLQCAVLFALQSRCKKSNALVPEQYHALLTVKVYESSPLHGQ